MQNNKLLDNLCLQTLEILRLSQDHELPLAKRITLYYAFGVTNFDITGWVLGSDSILLNESGFIKAKADKVLACLAIITAKKVLPIWEQFAYEDGLDSAVDSSDPVKMLKVAEGVLNSTYSVELASKDLCNRFYNGRTGLASVTPLNVYYANGVAYDALAITLNGLSYRSYEAASQYKRPDFADLAVAAYVTSDANIPGKAFYALGTLKEIGKLKQEIEDIKNLKHHIILTPEEDIKALLEDIEYLSEDLKGYKPIVFDFSKQLEFWEWWLTEAIPQAWELAEQSFNQK